VRTFTASRGLSVDGGGVGDTRRGGGPVIAAQLASRRPGRLIPEDPGGGAASHRRRQLRQLQSVSWRGLTKWAGRRRLRCDRTANDGGWPAGAVPGEVGSPPTPRLRGPQTLNACAGSAARVVGGHPSGCVKAGLPGVRAGVVGAQIVHRLSSWGHGRPTTPAYTCRRPDGWSDGGSRLRTWPTGLGGRLGAAGMRVHLTRGPHPRQGPQRRGARQSQRPRRGPLIS